MIYRFEDCELDLDRVVFRRDGNTVAVEPQVFDLLRCLLERCGNLVTKEELLDTVWGDRFVSESALTSRIKTARQAVGDDGTAQRVIRTVHGKGYVFVAEVSESDERPSEGSDRRRRPPPTTSSVRSTLPLAVNSLVGRDDTLAALTSELIDARLVTVVGPGGVGKTSLALELARRTSSTHRDGAALVELVGVGTPEEALAAVATSLDVSVRQNESIDTAIIDVLRPQELILVLDNCEHLVEPIAELVERILHTAPSVTVLATSREVLALAGERVHVVEPLDVAGLADLPTAKLAAVPAVALFVDRAHAADARFELTEANAAAVVEICVRLDGIPLALELAASRAAALDVTDIAQRLDERLRLLRAVRRGADPRHSRLLDTISWSYDLLDSDEQRLFTELAVFAGPFDLDAAEAVCAEVDVIDLLGSLSQRSMISVRRPAAGGTRYEMLETLREFGRSRLDDLSNVELFGRHAAHFASVARDAELVMRTVDEPAAVRRVDGSFADLRAAQRFSVDVGDIDTTLELITSVREYAMRTMRYEVFSWADAAATLVADTRHPLRPTLTGVSAYGAWVRGEFERSLELARAARDDEQSQRLAPSGLIERVLGNVLYITGDIAGGAREIEQRLPIAEETGLGWSRVHAYYMSSVSNSSLGNIDLARDRYEAAFEVARESASPTDLASAWTAKGFATRGDDEAALDAFASAERLAHSADNRWMHNFARTEASGLRICRGDLERGCAGLADTVDAWYRAGEWAQQWLTMSRCLIALDRIGQHELAAEVLGAIEQHTSLDVPPAMPTVAAAALATRESLIERFGDDRSAELAELGMRRPVAELVHQTRNALLGNAAGS